MSARVAALPALLGASLAFSPASAQDSSPAGSTAGPLTAADVIRYTLARSPDIALGRLEVQAQEGARMQASASFDPHARASLSRDRRRTPLFGEGDGEAGSLLANSLDYELGVDWLLRSGVTLSPSLSFSGADASSAPGVVRNTGVARLEAVLPLLRGRGGGGVRASERAATLDLQASRADLDQVRATSARNALVAYWGYVAARAVLAALQDAEARAHTLVEQTRALIEADERPAVDSISVLANAAAKTGARLSGENALILARQTLALAMGLPADSLGSLPADTDPFPRIPDDEAAAAWPADSGWVAQGLRLRADLASARMRRSAARTQLRGARGEARSRLDLHGGIGYTGIRLGDDPARFLSPLQSDGHGARLTLGLSYDLPVHNDAARGRLYRSAAAAERTAVAADEAARRIALAISTSAQTLRRSVQEARLSERAVRLFDSAVEGERQKFQLGTSTLFDVITAEDNRTGAQIGWINSQMRFAVAVAEMRYQTGSLLAGDGCPTSVPDPLAPAAGPCR